MNDSMKIEKIELVRDGVKKLLQSDEVMKKLEEEANARGKIDTSFVGFDRCHVHYKEN